MDVFLILVSSLFYSLISGLEIAFASSNKLRLELDRSDNKITNKALSFFYDNRSMFLSSLWITSLFSLFVYVAAVSSLLNSLECPWGKNLLFIVLIFFSISFLFMVMDFVLKLLFKYNPTSSFRFFTQFLFFLYIIVYPVLWFYISLLYLCRRKKQKANTGFSINKIGTEILDKEDIQKKIDVEENEVRIFQNALDFSSVKIKDCIVPRTEIIAIDLNATIADLQLLFVKSNYSRILVYRENIDNIVGYVHSSDMFDKPSDINSILNPLSVVPETMAANKLLKLFLRQKKSIALVVDEFGGTSGLITLEDVMEEIFGEIEDEHDEENEYIAKQLSSDEYLFSGRLEVENVNEQFSLELPTSEEYITIAGLILSKNEILPSKNDKIVVGQYQFSILKITATRIELVRLKILSEK